MANANFIVQNGISIGGTSGATITADPTTGAVAIAPAATAAVPNPTATVFTTAGTVTTVATTGGVPSTSDLGAAANTSTTSGATTFANITMTGNLASNSTGYFTIPAGTSAQRPASPAVGMMRYNSTITSFEGYYAGAWSSLGGVKSVDGKAYITAEASAGAGDDVIRVYAGDSGTSTQVMWASTSNINIRPTTTSTTPLTGALQVAGGAGVNGALFVGGGITTGTVSAATIGNASAVLYGTLNSSSASQPNVTTLAGLTGFGTSGVTTTAAGNFTITGSLTVNGTTTTINNTTVETTEYVQTIYATSVNSVTIGNSGAVLYGTLNSSSASQPNITTLAGVTSIGASGSTTLTGILQTAAQTNVTSLGTLTGLTTGTILPSANVTQNLGSTTAYWNNIYAVLSTVTATSAKYAD